MCIYLSTGLLHRWLPWPGDCPGRSQVPGIPSRVIVGDKSSSSWAAVFSFPRHISKELNQTDSTLNPLWDAGILHAEA